MDLKKLIDFVKPKEVINFENLEIKGISYNSKEVKEDDIFICIKGEHVDSHDFALNAVQKGAKAIFCEKEIEGIFCPQIIVESTVREMHKIAGLLYDFPSKRFKLIGVTGTNGKTTVVHLIQKIFEYDGQKCAIIGTLGNKVTSKARYEEVKHTTPQSPDLQRDFFEFAQQNIENVAIEVSSHALEQNRIGSSFFDIAAFTNLTQDHLDYHITMDRYFEAKAILFKQLKENQTAILNKDDKYFDRFMGCIAENVKILTYAIDDCESTDIVAKNIEFTINGVIFDLYVHNRFEKKVNLHLNGKFSVYNALCAIGITLASNIDINVIIEALEETKSVNGRFEIVIKKPLIIVDYAHTPDGLENVLKAARDLLNGPDSKLICVFGCGGDRDATKRPKMGEIADRLCDKLVITSDNPRSEDPDLIISDILSGVRNTDPDRIFVEPDRRLAISFIKSIAKENDVVVIAGKGHEDYQILKDKTVHFDDREEVLSNFS